MESHMSALEKSLLDFLTRSPGHHDFHSLAQRFAVTGSGARNALERLRDKNLVERRGPPRSVGEYAAATRPQQRAAPELCEQQPPAAAPTIAQLYRSIGQLFAQLAMTIERERFPVFTHTP